MRRYFRRSKNNVEFLFTLFVFQEDPTIVKVKFQVTHVVGR